MTEYLNYRVSKEEALSYINENNFDIINNSEKNIIKLFIDNIFSDGLINVELDSNGIFWISLKKDETYEHNFIFRKFDDDYFLFTNDYDLFSKNNHSDLFRKFYWIIDSVNGLSILK